MADSSQLVGVLRKKTAKGLGKLMNINPNLALENEARYRRFGSENFTDDNSKQALYAFRGHVYLGLKAEDFDTEILNLPKNTCAFSPVSMACSSRSIVCSPTLIPGYYFADYLPCY